MFGSSAGGHLAALVGTSGGVAELEDLTQGNASVSSSVSAVVDWYGPTDFAAMDEQLTAQGNCPPSAARHSEPGSGESKVVGCTVGDPACAANVRRANPITYVDGNEPPFLILHGSEDCISPRGQSKLLGDALRSAGACVSERTVVDAEHGGPAWTTAPVQDAVVEFLDRVLPP